MFTLSPRMDQSSIGLTTVQEKYSSFVQHMQTFLQALSNSKEARALNVLYDPVVRTASQIRMYQEASKHAVEKRTLMIFVEVHAELARLRGLIEREMSCVDIRSPDQDFHEFVHSMTEWETMNDVTYDFSEVRAKWPHREINHLSCVQARERFGGTVCILPVLMDFATKCTKLLNTVQQKHPKIDPCQITLGVISPDSNQLHFMDEHQNNNNDQNGYHEISGNVEANNPSQNDHSEQNSPQKSPKKKIPTNSKKRLEKFLANPDASMRLANGKICSSCKQPEGIENSSKNKKRGEEYNWQPARVWRGASKGAINHVAHRYCACKSHEETKAPDHSYHAPEIH